MLGELIKRFKGMTERTAALAPRVPEGVRLYAIGDIHGRLDLLDQLAVEIERDVKSASASSVVTIFLGDYIDRGPQSAGVIDKLSRGDFPTPALCLRGNHEEMLIKFLDDETVLHSWRNFGGLETLHSYGVPVADAMRGTGYAEAREQLLSALPDAHRTFLSECRSKTDCGDYFFCHAGAKPGVSLDAQTDNDLLWIRDEFLQYPGAFGKIVVHGHTPVEAPDVRVNRINIDTGAYASHNLTALVLETDTRRFLSTRRR